MLSEREIDYLPQIKNAISSLIKINDIQKIQMNELLLTKLIGEGGQAKVYEGYYQKKHCAITIFQKIDWKSFMNELVILSNLSHSNIPKFYGIVEEEKTIALVIEYIKGKTLEDVKINEISFSKKLKIVKKIGRVLEYMHVNHVIHRDLKPGNIMIDDNLNSFLIDFGISKICANKKDTITLTKGTLCYLAPECLDILQLTENEEIISKISPKVDVWAFGCLLSYIFSGINPWDNLYKDDAQNIQIALMNKKNFPIPDEIKKFPEIYQIIQKCTIVDSNERASMTVINDMIDIINYE